jgi:hypothetical protein
MPQPSVRRADLLSRVGTLLSTSFDAGIPLRDVQEAASHADPRTTMRYENPWELHQKGEIRAVCWLLRGGKLLGLATRSPA